MKKGDSEKTSRQKSTQATACKQGRCAPCCALSSKEGIVLLVLALVMFFINTRLTRPLAWVFLITAYLLPVLKSFLPKPLPLN
ncbi:hypothetical protein COY95_03300 [Candidatus Woesearchaeota archaeon CG_4_10_14_0_8_um_filter_47_5]|nr:MAG: hypothetical protein COY95_03300 [Candidatus Woesearchaeota archaeon CG_4_10_14_0_8_um_filter_47_5]